MPTHQHVETGKFLQVSNSFGVYLAGMADLPPTVCPELVPEGWDFLLVDGQPEILELTIAGEPAEGYVMRRLDFNQQ